MKHHGALSVVKMPKEISDDFQRKVLELTADITQAQFELNFFGLKAVALRKKI